MTEEKIRLLEKEARLLEIPFSDRKGLTTKVEEFASEFLSELPDIKTYFTEESLPSPELNHSISEDSSELGDILSEFKKEVLIPGINGASGGHMGYIPGGGVYPAALGDFLAAVTNKYAGVFYAAPGAVRLENMLIKWMCDLVGFPNETSGGNLTSGGSIANFIAVVAARELSGIKARDFEKSVIYFTQQAHHCVGKAIINAGLKEAVIRHVPMDENYRMRADILATMVEEDMASGLKPMVIIASAGTTDVGAVDPLDEIGDIANKHNIWYNVDAAYGGFFSLTDYGKKKLKGIEKADSVIIDPHKGLFLPFGTGAILVRDQNKLYNSQHLPANYMQDTLGLEEEFSPADLSPELTKHFRGVRMWLPLKLFGLKAFRKALEEKLELTRYFYSELEKEDKIEVGPQPDLSVFYYRIKLDDGDSNELTKQLMKEIHDDGRIFMSSTSINGNFYIRVAILCFRTHMEHVELALSIIKEKTIAIVAES